MTCGAHNSAAAVPAETGPVPGCVPPTKPQGAGPVSFTSSVNRLQRAVVAFRADRAPANCSTSTVSTGQKFLTERDLCARVAAVTRRSQRGELAQAAGSTKESARNWKDGTSCPNLAKTINMARRIPAVAEFVLSEIVGDENGPHALNAVIAGLHAVSSDPGPQGSAARALLTRLIGRT